jgi:large subunit ribosomal protein L24
MLKIKKDDTIAVLSGKDRGKQGKVMHVFPETRKALVQGINLAKKHKRRTQQDQQHSGIVQIEVPIALSNLAVVCTSCNVPTKIGFSVLKDKTKTRICKKCREAL